MIGKRDFPVSRLGPDIIAAYDPPIKMIWVERGNPVTQNPETNTVLEAVRSLDFRVVVEQFLTDTAREADIILPSKTMFEQTDVINAYWHSYIQIKQKVIDPPGEVKPESEIYRMLAAKLGMTSGELPDMIPGPSDEEIEAFLALQLEGFPDITLQALKQGPVLAPGHREIAFSDHKYSTPSGKIELYSHEAKEKWGLEPLPVFTESEESARGKSPEAQKYTLYLMTPNTKNRIHSQFNNLAMIKQVSPKPYIYINPEDAQSRNIKNKDYVKVYNDRGFLKLEARIDFSMKTGCVSVTNGWWITEGGTVNFLSKARETDMGFGAAFHDNLVEIEKVR
ncbi:molybdopterin-dependent oxidoreductase [candidate division KSB1 bacterium]